VSNCRHSTEPGAWLTSITLDGTSEVVLS